MSATGPLRRVVRRFRPWSEDPYPTPSRHGLGRFARCTRRLGRAVLVLTAVAVVGIALSSLFGGPVRLVVVGGNSMRPTYRTGDLLITWKGTPRPGDVVVYRPPSVDGAVVHRMVGRTADGRLLTRGDANRALDPWTPAPHQLLGIVRGPRLPLGPLVANPVWPTAAAAGLITAVLLWPHPARRRPEGSDPRPDPVVDLTELDLPALLGTPGITADQVAARLDAVLTDPQGAAALERAFADLPVSGRAVAQRLNRLLAVAGTTPPSGGNPASTRISVRTSERRRAPRPTARPATWRRGRGGT